jgi:two-component system, cell cycle sensor histidine kinase and response regulator CckA
MHTEGAKKLTEPFGYIIKPIADASFPNTVQAAAYKDEMEERLQTSQAWLAATLASVGDGIVACDTSGKIVFMNEAAEQLTGWESDAAKGKPLMEVLGLCEDSSRRPAENPVSDQIPGEHRVYSLISKGGSEHTVEIGCVENRSTEGTLGFILVLRSIGPRRELESRLLQSQRMEAAGMVAGSLAHDFNNLLTIMLGSAEELVSRLSGEQQSLAAEIKEAASLAGSITSQLLALSRRDTMRTEILNLNELIREMQPLISRSLGKNRILTVDLGSPEAFLWASRSRLKQILLNLALNARDAMAAGCELQISTSPVEIEEGNNSRPCYRSGRYVRLCVADTGHGMDNTTLTRIFEPFFTTKTDGAGTGLGLSIVHSIVVQSGGYITATSKPRQGTKFEILLPLISAFQSGFGQPATQAAQCAPFPSPSKSANKPRPYRE